MKIFFSDVQFKNSAGFIQKKNYILQSDFSINNKKGETITLV